MIELDDPIWEDLRHCYGPGTGIPEQLRRIETAKRLSKAFWDDLCNTLCHQCTVGTASFAAFPHLVRIAGDNVGNQKGFDLIKLASIILSYTLGPENKLPRMDKFLRVPFRDAILEGQKIIVMMLFQKKRSFRETMDFLSVIAAFDSHVDAALLLVEFRDKHLDCPECGERIETDRLYTI